MGVLQKTSLIAIIILHTVTYSVQEGYLQTGQCEPIRIPMCQSMPWNETKMPNLMDQTSQQNAMLKIEEYAPLGKCTWHWTTIFPKSTLFRPSPRNSGVVFDIHHHLSQSGASKAPKLE